VFLDNFPALEDNKACSASVYSLSKFRTMKRYLRDNIDPLVEDGRPEEIVANPGTDISECFLNHIGMGIDGPTVADFAMNRETCYLEFTESPKQTFKHGPYTRRLWAVIHEAPHPPCKTGNQITIDRMKETVNRVRPIKNIGFVFVDNDSTYANLPTGEFWACEKKRINNVAC
jgi:hypothetical protein